jgi:hypothetical protein
VQKFSVGNYLNFSSSLMKTLSLLQQCLLAVICLITVGSPFQARAATINWSSDFEDDLFNSTGATLDGTFSFEIGTFGALFIPTLANIDQWTANWKVFDRVYDPTPLDPGDGDPEGWNIPSQFFVGSAEHNAFAGSDSPDANPGDVFNQGEIGYLWIFNSKDYLIGPEWALLGNTSSAGDLGNLWVIPDPTDPPGTSYEWKLSDADTTVFGGANGIQGPGDYTVTPGSFSLQTAAVPEPGSALLIVIAGTCLGLSRRRRCTQVPCQLRPASTN